MMAQVWGIRPHEVDLLTVQDFDAVIAACKHHERQQSREGG